MFVEMGSERPDWLPAGWKVCVKVRSNGKKDKYYVDPSNGLKFNSKPEVLRHLQSSRKDKKAKDLDKVDIRKTVAEKLPPGWIKEIRTKKKGGKTRRDPIYIDPVSGRHFRSMQEVFRYLESKDSGKAESRPDGMELGNHPQSSPAEAKGQRLTDKKAEENLIGQECVKSEPKFASGFKDSAVKNAKMLEGSLSEQREGEDSPPVESDKLKVVKQHAYRTREIYKLADNKVELVNGDQILKSGLKVDALENVDTPEMINTDKQREREENSVARNILNYPPQVSEKEQHEGGRRQRKRLADSKMGDNITKDEAKQSGLEGVEGAAKKKINFPRTSGSERREEEDHSTGGQQHENLTGKRKRKSSKRKWMSDLPRRTSRRLARVEVDPSLEVKTSDKAETDASRPSGKAEVNDTKNISKAGLSDEPEIDTKGKHGLEHPLKCRTENPTNDEQKKPTTEGNLSSSGEHRAVGVDRRDNETQEKYLDCTLKDLLMDPCIEFAIKTLTGAISIEDASKVGDSPASSLASTDQTSASSSKLPTVGIWADPCFEFAVKTLTGETPVEDSSRFQVTVHQRLSPLGASGYNDSLTLPMYRSENIYPSNHSYSQFHAVEKAYVRQQGVGGSQNTISTSLQQGFGDASPRKHL